MGQSVSRLLLLADTVEKVRSMVARQPSQNPFSTVSTLSRHSSDSRVASVAPITLTVRRRGTNPTDIPRPGPARANARVGLRAKFPGQELSCRLGHDVAAADIDAGGREGAVRLLGGGGGRDGGAGF